MTNRWRNIGDVEQFRVHQQAFIVFTKVNVNHFPRSKENISWKLPIYGADVGTPTPVTVSRESQFKNSKRVDQSHAKYAVSEVEHSRCWMRIWF
jgi:hypothetical protein